MPIKVSWKQSVQIQFSLFLSLFVVALNWALLMTCLRFWTFLNIRSDFQNVGSNELLQAFFMGFRFDVLVNGFILIPLTLLLFILTLLKQWPVWLKKFLKMYQIIFWFLISAISGMDLYFFTLYRRRMSWQQYSTLDLHHLEIFKLSYGSVYFYVYSLTVLAFFVTGIYVVLKNKTTDFKPSQVTQWKLPNNSFAFFLSFIAPILIVTLMARGNLESHHLAIEHCQIGEQTIAREICISAPWNLDK